MPFYRQVVEHADYVVDGRDFHVHNRWIENDFEGHIEPWAEPSLDRLPDELGVHVGRRELTEPIPARRRCQQR